MVFVRPARREDRQELLRMRLSLWPEGTAEEHADDLDLHLAGKSPGVLPYAVLVAEADDGTLAGFAEVSLRSYADGCDPARPVGYLEGWFVTEEARRRGVGTALVNAAETWARGQGCLEMASDTWLDNEEAQSAHRALGFEEVDRCVNYKKRLS
jgi:aminoglycoside 6'-N-acetyltransferase I